MSEGMRMLELGGVRSFYRDDGSGKAVLLVHGAGPGIDADISWSNITPALAERFRVISVDTPGYGRSDVLQVTDSPENVAAHLLRLLDAIGVEKVAVVGHSRGARVGCEMAAAAPSRISHLAILSSGSVVPDGFLDEAGRYTESALALGKFGQDGDTTFVKFKNTLQMMVYRPEILPESLLQQAYAAFMTRCEEYIARTTAFDRLTYYSSATAFNEGLRHLRAPTLVICGREDRTSPYKRQLALIEAIPNVQVNILSECAHFAELDRPNEVTRILIEFLERGEAARAPLPSMVGESATNPRPKVSAS